MFLHRNSYFCLFSALRNLKEKREKLYSTSFFFPFFCFFVRRRNLIENKGKKECENIFYSIPYPKVCINSSWGTNVSFCIFIYICAYMWAYVDL